MGEPKRTWINRLVLASGWIFAALTYTLDVPEKINSFYKEAPTARRHLLDSVMLNEDYTGIWTSENDSIDDSDHNPAMEALDGGPVHLQMSVYGGNLSGEIVTGGLGKYAAFSRVQISGREVDGHLEGVVFDYVGGHPNPMAEVRIDKRVGDSLSLNVIRQYEAFLPLKAVLLRTDKPIPDGQFGSEYMKVLKEVAGETVHKKPPQ